MPDYLPEDIKRQQNENGGRLVPTEGEVGYFLAVTGLSPFSYAFRQGPNEEIPRYPGSPDGELTAPIDSLVRNTVDHTVWINTDGATAWQLVGSGAGGDSEAFYRAEFQLEDPGEGDARLLFLAGGYEENGPGASIGEYLNPGDALNIDVAGIYSISLSFYVNDEAEIDDHYEFEFFGGDMGEAGSYPFNGGFDVRKNYGKSSLWSIIQVDFAWTGWLDALENSITIQLINHGSGVTSGNPTFGAGRFYIQRIS